MPMKVRAEDRGQGYLVYVQETENHQWRQATPRECALALHGAVAALKKIGTLTDQFDDDDHAYQDVDTLQVFENRVSDIVGIALSSISAL